jgi:hypothetical protein
MKHGVTNQKDRLALIRACEPRKRLRLLLAHHQRAYHLVDIEALREIGDFHAADFACSHETQQAPSAT